MIKAAYIHIPFCEHICHYCDFNKVFLQGQPVDEYLNSLKKEIELTLEAAPTTHLDSIFVGGGTPTALNEKQLQFLCETINELLPYNQDTEFTFEANPGDLSKEKFQILHDAGVNRLSFGVQTFNDELLKSIGRTHRAADVFKSVELAKNTGFKNISVDLIYSLPGQTLDDFRETLETSFSLDINHYSGYSLIIEPKTVFYNLMRKGRLPLPGEDTEAAMYEVLMEEMAKHAFTQYEISNFAQTGYESKHNLTYWNNDEYYGFGAGAHGYVSGRRRSNFGPLKKYMEPLQQGNLPILEETIPTFAEQMEEEMFLGLRKNKGVSVQRFIDRYGKNPLDLFKNEMNELTEKDLIDVQHNQIMLTKKGRFLGNEVFQSFLGVVEDEDYNKV
ncbi:radical SAM family heme chaperone HemW [Robertmurraya kyonggiensis]|uniref:Heme chaperone HemW n=1 Tax=Robertmurraya kyonggiensis TaxID=1037680 RepID=A0A4V5P223_9BACI|nr:radical SAM family heme chaperone HemW [Robertmurraya kyonggiensis]TKC20190.1 oxygen-independent coproporphyrinogen III oxidase [Robertmurraya kyonggiensis]